MSTAPAAPETVRPPRAPSGKKSGMSRSVRNNLTAYSFIAPNFVGFCVFTLVPMVAAIFLSLCN